MSGLQGSPQNIPPDEGLRPEDNEGLQDHGRQVFTGVEISPNSIVSETPDTERLQVEGTPTPNTSANRRPSKSHDRERLHH